MAAILCLCLPASHAFRRCLWLSPLLTRPLSPPLHSHPLLQFISCCADYLLKLLLITWRGGIQRERSPPQLAWPLHLHVLCMHSDLDVCPSFVNFFMFSRGKSKAKSKERGLRGVAAGWQLLPPFATAENATESLLSVCFVLVALFSSWLSQAKLLRN